MLNLIHTSNRDSETQSSGRNNARHSSVFNEVSIVPNSVKGFSRVEQMSESGLSNDDEAKVEQVSDGRWTREEHYCFLKAVAVYGREWKLVQTAIKTRTSAQIRSHAQKYFQKCAKQEQSTLATGVSEDAFVVLELCEKVLKTLKKKRDDYNLANKVPMEDSDHEGSTENEMESTNNSLNSSSSTANTSNHSVYSFAYPVGEESTVLGRDELIALEFLCCNQKDNYSPLKRNLEDMNIKVDKSMEIGNFPCHRKAETQEDGRNLGDLSNRKAFNSFQYKDSISAADHCLGQNKRVKM